MVSQSFHFVSQSFQLFKHKANSELAQTTPESLYRGEGPHKGETAPYGSKRPCTGVKGAHKGERLRAGKGAHDGDGPTEVKRPMKVNFKQGGSQKFCCSLHLRTYPLLSHFQNDGATVECSTLVLLQI